ncbi:MFS transporter [Cellulomonas sp. WB94]|uniref:MFS transporter n=1 Tax=Cellulomonas sp. WB94 TaxID=2173174 RepID=UPI0013048570|nr:MFS transporter [Cellulomonas sp. WB94]
MGSTTDSAANVRHEQDVAPDDAAHADGDRSDASWLYLPEVAVARRRTLRVLLVAQVLGSLGIGAAPSIGVLLAQELTRSEAWAGIARASVTIGAALLALPLGMLAARRGRRRALTLAWGSAAVGAALLVVAASTTSVLVMVLGMMALGAGSAAGLQSRFAATDLAVPVHRARSLSLVVWVGTLGRCSGRTSGSRASSWSLDSGCPRCPARSSSVRCS